MSGLLHTFCAAVLFTPMVIYDVWAWKQLDRDPGGIVSRFACLMSPAVTIFGVVGIAMVIAR